MSVSAQTEAPPRRGRPSTGARERILEAATEVLKDEGYAGLTVAKVAARAGESKALISYHFGSKDGLIAEVGRSVAAMITERVLAEIESATTVEAVIRGVALGVEKIALEDERVPRLYFDLAAVSVVKPEVRATITELISQWREVVGDLLARAQDSPAPKRIRPLTLMVIAGVQGMELERIGSADAGELAEARELFVTAAVAAAR